MIPGNNRVANLAALALEDAPAGSVVWVDSEGCRYEAVPTYQAISGAIPGPSDLAPTSWQPATIRLIRPNGTRTACVEIGEDYELARRSGCVGDGTTLDTANFQGMVDRVSAIGGGRIQLQPNKIYRVQDIQARSAVIIEGCGAGGGDPTLSRIRCGNLGHAAIRIGGEGSVKGFAVNHVEFDSDGLSVAEGSGTRGIYAALSNGEAAQQGTIYKCTFRQLEKGIQLGDDTGTDSRNYDMWVIDQCVVAETRVGIDIASINATNWRISNSSLNGLDVGLDLTHAGYGSIEHTDGGAGTTAFIRVKRIDKLTIDMCQCEPSRPIGTSAGIFLWVQPGCVSGPVIHMRDDHFPFGALIEANCHLVLDTLAIPSTSTPGYEEGKFVFATGANSCLIDVVGPEIPKERFQLLSNCMIRRNGWRNSQTASNPDGFPRVATIPLTTTGSTVVLAVDPTPVGGLFDVIVNALSTDVTTLDIVIHYKDRDGQFATAVVPQFTTAAGAQHICRVPVHGHDASTITVRATAGTANVTRVDCVIVPLNPGVYLT
jgi:hypothetical protein